MSAKEMIMVPRDMFERNYTATDRKMQSLDEKMSSVLNDSELSTDEKYIEYLSTLLEYLKKKDKKLTEHPTVFVASSKETTQAPEQTSNEHTTEHQSEEHREGQVLTTSPELFWSNVYKILTKKTQSR